MASVQLLAKHNRDGGYSVSYKGGQLVHDAFVDFYNEQTGAGFQRNETLRPKRGRDVEEYIRRCVTDQVEPKLFEMTANARVKPDAWKYEPLGDRAEVGFLTFEVGDDDRWLSMIDGGTRLLGIENALAEFAV